MNQSENPAYSMSSEQITFFVKVQGAGAAAPVRAPTTVSATSYKSFMLASNNYVSLTATDITRSAQGVYTLKLRDTLPSIMNIHPEVAGPSGTWASVSDYNPSTQVLSFLVFAAAGTAADLAATEFLTFTIFGQKVKPTY